MFYYNLNKTNDSKRVAERILELKQAVVDSGIPPKCEDTMLLATWNIREFDSAAYGKRDYEPLYYIAEICSHFDLIAVQEVREDLSALKKVRDILGSSNWSYIVTDVSEGTPGNRERMAFLYDKRAVKFAGMAGEIVIPPIDIKEGRKTIRYDPTDQLYRTPFLCSFRSGWTEYLLSTVHILYGEDKADNPKRAKEISLVAEFLAKRARERATEYNNLVLIGDFNIYKKDDITMKALTDAGFEIPLELQSVPVTNVGIKGRHYDQIAFHPKKLNLETTGKAGVFDYYNTVYTDDDEAVYIQEMGEAYNVTSKGKVRDTKGKSRYYRTYWRTHQMSDHLPMWIQFKTNFAKEYLKEEFIQK